MSSSHGVRQQVADVHRGRVEYHDVRERPRLVGQDDAIVRELLQGQCHGHRPGVATGATDLLQLKVHKQCAAVPMDVEL